MNKKHIIIAVGLVIVVLASIGAIAAVFIKRNNDNDDKDEVIAGGTVRERVMKVLNKSLIIDGHNDLPWQYQSYQNKVAKVRLSKQSVLFLNKQKNSEISLK